MVAVTGAHVKLVGIRDLHGSTALKIWVKARGRVSILDQVNGAHL